MTEPPNIRRIYRGPSLIVVSGPPGTGKTTLAHAIARGVGCPAICRDEIREGLMHAGTPDRSMRRTYDAFFDTLGVLLRAGSTVVAEAAFQDRLWRPILYPLAGLAGIRVVRCLTDPAVARERMVRRLAEPNRAAHGDREYLARSSASPGPAADQAADQAPADAPFRSATGWKPISLDVPTLVVDTGDGYAPVLPDIVAFAAGR